MSKWRWIGRSHIFMAIAAHATPRCGGTYHISRVPYEYAPPQLPPQTEWRAETAESGFAVGVVNGPIVKADDKDDLWSILLAWHSRNADEIERPHRALGLWYHEGFWHIDIVEVISDKSLALERAAKNGEIAIYDLSARQEIRESEKL